MLSDENDIIAFIKQCKMKGINIKSLSIDFSEIIAIELFE